MGKVCSKGHNGTTKKYFLLTELGSNDINLNINPSKNSKGSICPVPLNHPDTNVEKVWQEID